MIPNWVEPLIGFPFLDRGRGLDGWDCYGIVHYVYTQVFQVEIPSYDSHYGSHRDKLAVARVFFLEATSSRWRKIGLADAAIPDVLAMSVAGERHVAVVVAPGRFLHVLRGRETCVERLRPLWEPRIEAVYRHRSYDRVGVLA
jgi:cell wall-associated NlpC family hydrolase